MLPAPGRSGPGSSRRRRQAGCALASLTFPLRLINNETAIDDPGDHARTDGLSVPPGPVAGTPRLLGWGPSSHSNSAKLGSVSVGSVGSAASPGAGASASAPAHRGPGWATTALRILLQARDGTRRRRPTHAPPSTWLWPHLADRGAVLEGQTRLDPVLLSPFVGSYIGVSNGS